MDNKFQVEDPELRTSISPIATMESSRIAWIALSLLGLMLAAAPVGEAQRQYNVGGIPDSTNWYPQQDTSFYQNWADGLTLYANDTLMFLYDPNSHDVTQLWSADDWSSCTVKGGGHFTGGTTWLLFVDIGTYYFTSTGSTSTSTSSDCQQGMVFSVTVQPGGPGGSTAAEDLPPLVQNGVPLVVISNQPAPDTFSTQPRDAQPAALPDRD